MTTPQRPPQDPKDAEDEGNAWAKAFEQAGGDGGPPDTAPPNPQPGGALGPFIDDDGEEYWVATGRDYKPEDHKPLP